MSQHRYQPMDPRALRTYSMRRRAHKAHLDSQAALPPVGASASQLMDSFPPMLGAAEFRAVVDAIVAARSAQRPVVWAMGGHVVKVGCSPIVVDLIRRGLITAVAMNGSTAIHDVEMATMGATSEEVAQTLRDGSFGMVEETLAFFSEAVTRAESDGVGLGLALGRQLKSTDVPYVSGSILACAVEMGIPVTVHMALGTDTVHLGTASGAAWGAATMFDFRLLCSVVADLGAKGAAGPGGVWLNIGSAVVLPEVFLKAVSAARNLGADLDAMVTANFDMLKHYRPTLNVVQRPTTAGRGHTVIGHHEMLLPMLRQALIDRWHQGAQS